MTMLWCFQELQKFGSPNIVMALVGNKSDLQASRKVAVEVCVSFDVCSSDPLKFLPSKHF